MKRVLITGATGFVGSWLAETYLNTPTLKGKVEEVELHCTRRRRSDLSNVEHIKNNVKWIELDVEDMRSCIDALEESQPDIIHHLAAQTFVPTSWRAPQQTFMVNAIGTINLLEAIRVVDINPIMHFAGSSEEYGLVKENEVPVKETNPLRPMSPYGVSKVAGDLTCQQYHKSYKIKTVITRAFNHSGARRGEVFVTSNFAKQIAEIEKKLREPIIYVGNLNAERDFTDVRDICKAYMLIEHCKFGDVYNICSGKVYSINQVLNILLNLSNTKDIKISVDQNRMRPSDVPILIGNCDKFKDVTDWEPEIKFEKTMEDLLNYWRNRR